MKYYLVAGEASGDLHGSNLIHELKATDPDADFRFFGGDLMEKAGGTLVKHYREMAFMGFVDVVLNLKTIRRNMLLCKQDLLNFKPDVLILIDYPGFNLRIAEFAKQNNIPVYYYISPKFWAWKERRVKKVRRYVDEMFTIFPFETEFYKKHGIDVHYVGNPLMDSLEAFKSRQAEKKIFFEKNDLDNRPVVTIMAGSRVNEIKRMLPLMIKATEGFNEFQFVVAGVGHIPEELYKSIISDRKIALVKDQAYDLLNHSFAALVTSGTAALETALFNVPQTVIYKMEGGLLVDVIMRNFVLKTNWVSLPNIILQKMAVQEFIQKDMTLKNVREELGKLLYNYDHRNRIVKDYTRLKGLMGEAGCSARAADKMVQLLKS